MAKQTTILKFGGTSLGTPEAIAQVITLITERNEKPLGVVVSAYAGVTDTLYEIARLACEHNKKYRQVFLDLSTRQYTFLSKIIKNSSKKKTCLKQVEQLLQDLESILLGVWLTKELTSKTLAFIVGFGEQLSAMTLTYALQAQAYPAEYVDGRKLIITNSQFTNAGVDFSKTNVKIASFFQNSNQTVKIITGFIAATPLQETTTLGRGGSDYTAAIVAAALNASGLEIWTDVNGIMSADPRKISDAFTIPVMSYAEAMEMSHFGAKVIYPPTLVPVMRKGIPLYIKNTFSPFERGTAISHTSSHEFPIKGITTISSVSVLLIQGSGMIGVPGIAMRLFGVLGKNNINIILITQASSEHTICFCIAPQDVLKAKMCIEEEFTRELADSLLDPVSVASNKSILAVVGERMRKTPGIAAKIFTALASRSINIEAIAQGSSELNISIVIDKSDEAEAIHTIHTAFFKKTL